MSVSQTTNIGGKDSLNKEEDRDPKGDGRWEETRENCEEPKIGGRRNSCTGAGGGQRRCESLKLRDWVCQAEAENLTILSGRDGARKRAPLQEVTPAARERTITP